ncbi:hypothetical protein EFQ99_29030 [Rhizobium vallis]|uniref:Type IV secretion system protein VirB7 n=1 Tax=Rhizobium vallis TaxID=634290 RepID=A0A3S0T217_9HYPH|nr:hypothetical protein [Rhizobium vallis]RUM20674.1 hypothetical protein EFQ99_29030 [Rhizobium vallis]
MIRIILSLALAIDLTGCASISHPLPKCDGYSRRPLNRSMWQWEDNNAVTQPASETAPATAVSHVASYGEEPVTVEPAAFAHFDPAGSYRPCGEQ